MHTYDSLRMRNGRQRAPATRGRARRVDVGLVTALSLASCLPLDDLSRYSRGEAAEPDAGARQLTRATDGTGVEREHGTPGRGHAPSRGTGPESPGEESEPASGDEGKLPVHLDAGAPRGLPEGCVERPEADAGLGSCYSISREPAIWSEALARCERWGGSLVSINSASESDWLAATVDVTIWIGSSDRRREGTFEWANGDPFQFELFAEGEPDNTFGVQDCVERRSDSSWNDRVCSVQNPFVCERPL